jgi:hypothetical protein
LASPFDFSFSQAAGLRLGVPVRSLLKYSEDGSLRRGVACLVRAIAKYKRRLRCDAMRRTKNRKYAKGDIKREVGRKTIERKRKK